MSVENGSSSDGIISPDKFMVDKNEIVDEYELGSGAKVVDRRRITPESVESDFQASQENLRQPLGLEEQTEASRAIEETLSNFVKNLGADGKFETPQQEKNANGDVRAANTLRRLLEAQSNDGDLSKACIEAKPGEGVDAFLGRMIDKYRSASVRPKDESGSVDFISGKIDFAGYDGAKLYEYTRAADIFNKMNADPVSVRVGMLGAEDVIGEGSDNLLMALQEDLVLPLPATREKPTVYFDKPDSTRIDGAAQPSKEKSDRFDFSQYKDYEDANMKAIREADEAAAKADASNNVDVL